MLEELWNSLNCDLDWTVVRTTLREEVHAFLHALGSVTRSAFMEVGKFRAELYEIHVLCPVHTFSKCYDFGCTGK
jgi:hypothetical protein